MQFCFLKKFEKIDLSSIKGCFDAFAKRIKNPPLAFALRQRAAFEKGRQPRLKSAARGAGVANKKTSSEGEVSLTFLRF